jgi:vancomycin resistance protein YoaR
MAQRPNPTPPLAKPRDLVKLVSSDTITFANKNSVLDPGSLHNLMLAAKYLNGVTLGPGNIFSFNQAVGPRTVANGFVTGISVIDYKFTPDLGGGVCGTSTVLYQAVKKAGLPVVERYTHDIPVPYIAPGQGAAVWYGVEDFKFKNTLPGDLRINTYGKGYTLTVRLYEILK